MIRRILSAIAYVLDPTPVRTLMMEKRIEGAERAIVACSKAIEALDARDEDLRARQDEFAKV